ncbi:MAG: peptidoglycan-associated lipoprotein Pal [Alphaproteobacteria bacterium]|nr:peptidoglycan-associated lipoprotein Pal [Alphaproteobacteria bacterium]
MHHFAKTAAALCSVLLLVGCSTTKPPVTPSSAAASTSSAVQSSIVPGSERDFQVNVGDTVHFDYNKYDLRDSDKAILQRQADWLKRYPSVRITVQGNCDERGTREYNLALGARRANSVKEYLVSLGVSMGRVDTISYGKERPICSESTEACWAQNRRAVTAIAAGASS